MKLLIVYKETIMAVNRRRSGAASSGSTSDDVFERDARAVNLRSPQEIEMGENPEHSAGSPSSALNGSGRGGTNANVGSTQALLKSIGYDDIANYCFGAWGSVIMKTIVFSTNMGISIGYMAIIKNGFTEDGTCQWAIKELFGITSPTMSSAFWLCLMFPALVAINMVRVSKLSFVSLLGNVAVMSTVLVCCSLSIQTLVGDAPKKPAPGAGEPSNDPRGTLEKNVEWKFMTLSMGGFTDYMSTFGLFMFSFVMHGVILPQHERLREGAERKKAKKTLNLAAGFVALVYIVFASFCYGAYGESLKNGENGQGILTTILNDLQYKKQANTMNGVAYQYTLELALMKLCTFLLSIAIFCSLPLFYDEPFSIIGMSWTEESDILAEDKKTGESQNAAVVADSSSTAGADNVQRFQVLDVDVPVTAENVLLEQSSSVAGSSASGSTAQQPLLYHQDIAEVNPQLDRSENAGRLVSAQPLAGAGGSTSVAGAQQAGQQQASALSDEQRARMTKLNTRAAVKRGLVLLVCVGIVFQCGDISAILGLVGALCMANLGCILPAAFYYRFSELKVTQAIRMNSVGGTRVAITGFLGVIGMLVGSYMNIQAIIKGKGN